MDKNFRVRKYIVVICSLLILIISELLLRALFGLGNAPLYEKSNSYEYIACPNQNCYRFGNHIKYNSYSQRSDEPDSTKNIVLGLGDSVLFGGTMLDQDSLATTLFTKETDWQMLNNLVVVGDQTIVLHT